LLLSVVRLIRVVLITLLMLSLGSSGALPVWAQLVGVEGPHVCHCSLEKHDCVCPRCNTDPDAAMFLSAESLKGRCGDDEVAFGGRGIIAIAPSPDLFVKAPEQRAPRKLSPLEQPEPIASRPEVPPPRRA